VGTVYVACSRHGTCEKLAIILVEKIVHVDIFIDGITILKCIHI
jgi:hypothetical protein